MTTYMCISMLDNVGIALNHAFSQIEFSFCFQIFLELQWSDLPKRIKVYSLSETILIVAHPMTPHLIGGIQIHYTAFPVVD